MFLKFILTKCNACQYKLYCLLIFYAVIFCELERSVSVSFLFNQNVVITLASEYLQNY